jgi:hypothetical protein
MRVSPKSSRFSSSVRKLASPTRFHNASRSMLSAGTSSRSGTRRKFPPKDSPSQFPSAAAIREISGTTVCR